MRGRPVPSHGRAGPSDWLEALRPGLGTLRRFALGVVLPVHPWVAWLATFSGGLDCCRQLQCAAGGPLSRGRRRVESGAGALAPPGLWLPFRQISLAGRSRPEDTYSRVSIDRSQLGPPGSPHTVLQLFLACPNPRSIVLLGNLDAFMPEQDRNLIEWYSREEHFHCKRVAKHLGMTALGRPVRLSEVGDSEQASVAPLPVCNSRLRQSVPAPEKIHAVWLRSGGNRSQSCRHVRR